MTKVAHVASEVAPWAQSGGLGSVLGALPAAQHRVGLEVAVVAPLHRGVRERAQALGAPLVDTGIDVAVELDGATVRGRLHEVRHGGARICFVDCPLFYDRPGLYGEGGVDYPDNAFRFAFLARAALDAGPRLFAAGAPDVWHCHDWQAGLLPAYLGAGVGGGRRTNGPRVVFTIDNLAFQGLYDPHLVPALGLPWNGFVIDGFEFWGKLSFLKAGSAFADVVTTVSPTYAKEISRPEFGCGLDGFLAARDDVIGVLNGIDTASWDPAIDRSIDARFDADDVAGKARCRTKLGHEMGLARGGMMLGVVSRLTAQKGVDLVIEMAPRLAELGARLVVLGTGERALEERLVALAEALHDHVAVRIGFDERMARRIFAGSDGLLMPSRFEPCGLAQMQAMRYGALPIVNPVGGLADTVEDGVTGFHMAAADLRGLVGATARAATLHRDPAAWRRAQRTAMHRDWSWDAPASAYRDRIYLPTVRNR